MSLVSSKQKLGDKELKLLQLNGSRIRSEQPEFAEHHSLLKLDALRLTIATKVEGECDDNGLMSQNIQNKGILFSLIISRHISLMSIK